MSSVNTSQNDSGIAIVQVSDRPVVLSTLSTENTNTINVQVNNNSATNDNSITTDNNNIYNVVVNNIPDNNTDYINAKINNYNALVNNTTQGIFEQYDNNELIQFSDTLQTQFNNTNFNPQIQIKIQFDNDTNPQLLTVQGNFPSIIANMFNDGSYTMYDNNGNTTVINDKSQQSLQYTNNLKSTIILQTIV